MATGHPVPSSVGLAALLHALCAVVVELPTGCASVPFDVDESIEELPLGVHLIQVDVRANFSSSSHMRLRNSSEVVHVEEVAVEADGSVEEIATYVKIHNAWDHNATHVPHVPFHLTSSSGNQSHQKLTPSTQVLYVPINSAGENKGLAKIGDIILIVIAFLIPVVIYCAVERVETSSQDKEEEHPMELNRVARMGSSYHIGETGADASVSLVGLMSHKLREKTTPEEDTSAEEEGHVQNILAGFSTAMAALPDAISFSFITGVSPLNGIWAGAFMGVSAALVGGRPGMISSASAATAVVLADVSLDEDLGMGPMALCVFLVGIFQLIAGALRLSRFVSLIPHPVMLGFVNGLAIVMIKAQMRQFHYSGDGPWVEANIMCSMIITALFAILSALVWARLPFVARILPPPLASVVLTAAFSIVMKSILVPRTLKDVAGSHTFSGGLSTLPSWDFPPAGVVWDDASMWKKVISTAVRFAIVGMLESLMTQALIDQITKTSGSMRRECFGQGVGNLLASLFGTQGGCALIAQSLLNVSSGGRTRLSGVTMGITLVLSVVLLAPVMAIIPVAALVGLITLIALNTFAWGSLQLILKINWVDATVVVVVTLVTVFEDLAIAVVSGVIINALGFAWHCATEVTVDSEENHYGERVFRLLGPLFFGSALNYQTAVVQTPIQEATVVLDFKSSNVLDISGIEAITKVKEFLENSGKKVVLVGLPQEILSDISVEEDTPGVAQRVNVASLANRRSPNLGPESRSQAVDETPTFGSKREKDLRSESAFSSEVSKPEDTPH